MMPVALDRLRDGRDISAVLRGRRQRAGRFVVLHVRQRGEGGTPPRVAVVASRRTGNAVERNRAKRLLREAARQVTWVGDIDVVLVARAACAGSGFSQVHAELSRLAGELDVAGDDIPATADPEVSTDAVGSGVGT